MFGQYSKSVRSLLFIRSSKGLQNLILAIHDSRVALYHVITTILLMSTLFGWMLYLVEYPENENFDSVLDTSWFAIVTMSTIGYGNEQVPKTILGKFVTVKCAIFGIICMALPIPFIAASWQRLYIIQMRDFHGPVGKYFEPKELVNDSGHVTNQISSDSSSHGPSISVSEKLNQRNKLSRIAVPPLGGVSVGQCRYSPKLSASGSSSELWNLYRQGVAEYEQKRSRNLSGRKRSASTSCEVDFDDFLSSD